MVEDPGVYRWSSYRFNADGFPDALVSLHPLYEQLGDDPASRRAAYRALFSTHIDDRELDKIRDATQTGTVLGHARFRGEIENALQRRLHRQPHGGDRHKINGSESLKSEPALSTLAQHLIHLNGTNASWPDR